MAVRLVTLESCAETLKHSARRMRVGFEGIFRLKPASSSQVPVLRLLDKFMNRMVLWPARKDPSQHGRLTCHA